MPPLAARRSSLKCATGAFPRAIYPAEYLRRNEDQVPKTRVKIVSTCLV